MKETDKKKIPNIHQIKRSRRSERRDRKLPQDNAYKILNAKETESKASFAKTDSDILLSDPNTGTEPYEVYRSMVVHYMDDVSRFEGASQDSKTTEMFDKVSKYELNDKSNDLEKELKHGNEEVSDSETIKDSSSSQGDAHIAEHWKVERTAVSKKLTKRDSTEGQSHASRVKSDRGTNNLRIKALHSSAKNATKSNKGPCKATTENKSNKSLENVKFPPKHSSESFEGVDEKPLEDVKEMDVLDETSNGAQIVGSDDETVNNEENSEHKDHTVFDQKIKETETRIEKLEEELREVAALEISLYSIVPEHGSSAHKLQTPARRISRLYIHACKYWSQDKRATVARNTVSGLILVAKSCGNEVPRLTFWLSNMVVLREIISQACGNSCISSSVSKIFELNGGRKKSEGKSSSLNWRVDSDTGQTNNHGFIQFVDDWLETRTFTTALEKVESWIFSRIVESIWWQILTPNMQSPVEDLNNYKSLGRLLGPALGDQQQGSFSISLWKNAFQDAFKRLCPVHAGGQKCGCLPVLARMVMEQCIERLDVAMFNAILRESAHQIPTDPVSDPIVDSKVLPIPAGDLSFGSGAQLKNSVFNWSRWLNELLGIDADDSNKDGDKWGGDSEPKYFHLLSDLSDLLMLPKDMLMDRSIRMEVCPSISLPLVKRILCNFTPDEFCPDPVPGTVLEALNAESIIERRLSGKSAISFPYGAAPVVYTPPSSANLAEKVVEAGEKSHLAGNTSSIQNEGYTSDEDLEELESPLASIIDKFPPSPMVVSNGNGIGNGKHKHQTSNIGGNARYEFLREVWLA